MGDLFLPLKWHLAIGRGTNKFLLLIVDPLLFCLGEDEGPRITFRLP